MLWERMGKLRGNEEMERDWLSTFPHSLFISYIKICHILMQNAKYGTFVANVTKIIIYALWGNTSGSDLLRGSSASCAGLAWNTIKQHGWPPLKLAGSILLFHMSTFTAKCKKNSTCVSTGNIIAQQARFPTMAKANQPTRPQFTCHFFFKSSFIQGVPKKMYF